MLNTTLPEVIASIPSCKLKPIESMYLEASESSSYLGISLIILYLLAIKIPVRETNAALSCTLISNSSNPYNQYAQNINIEESYLCRNRERIFKMKLQSKYWVLIRLNIPCEVQVSVFIRVESILFQS